MDISIHNKTEGSFIINIDFCNKNLRRPCEISDYDLKQKDESFYINSLEHINPDKFLKNITIVVSHFLNEDLPKYEITDFPLSIKNLINEKIFDTAFEILQEKEENLIESDKTKIIIEWQ